MAFCVGLASRKKYFFLALLFLSLNFQVAAKTDAKAKREFVESFKSIRSQVSDAFENQNKTSFCALLGDYEKALQDGWYYLRDSGFSYEELNETKWFIHFSYKKNCL